MMLPAGIKQSAQQKLSRIRVAPPEPPSLPHKPEWLRIRLTHNPRVRKTRELLRAHSLHTVCEEASCPNLSECFGSGTATFMLLGDVCTRRCAFCDVAHGRPLPVDSGEPQRLAEAIASLRLDYVVLTSVDRDDLHDGGSTHFAQCIQAIREQVPQVRIEILTPDFRGRMPRALEALAVCPPDVFNHNLETVPQLYPAVRPGASYQHSLKLLQQFGEAHPEVPTKSGLMLGLGETMAQVRTVLRDLIDARCQMLTLGQYLQPTVHHYPVMRYVTPREFDELGQEARAMGFTQVASGPLVRSSYHAGEQTSGAFVYRASSASH